MTLKIYLYTLCLISLFISPEAARAQSFYISGTIVDGQGQPIPFVSVQIKENHSGTVANENGDFKIPVKDMHARILVFSALGYKTYTTTVDMDQKWLNITLQSDARQLDGIFIFPDSSLKALIVKAYRKINDNYPQHFIELTGFYRAYQKSVLDDRYLYFAESSLRVQQSGYQNPGENAQIDMLKLHNLRFPHRDSVDNVRYYGGPFIADWNDPVRKRALFLNPLSFNRKYTYQLEAVVQYNFDKDSAYVIQFKSMDKEQTMQGRFWIDKETSSYIKIEWSDNHPQNLNPFIPSRKITKNYLTIYQKHGVISLVNYTSLKTKIYNSKTRKESNSVLEFITTACNLTGHFEPIPVKKRLQYGMPISEMENYGDKNFEDDYQRIKNDSLLSHKPDSSITFKRAKSESENLAHIKSHGNFRAKIFRFTKNITTSYALTGATYKSIGVDNFYLNYADQKNHDPRDVPARFIPGTLLGIGYKLTPLSYLSINFLNALSKTNLYKLTSITYQKFFLIRKIGNPLFLTASIGLTAGKTGFSLGTLSSEKDLVLDGERLKRNTKIYLGNTLTSVQAGIGFEYRKRKVSYFAELQYRRNIREKDIFQFKLKENFLTSKTIVTPYPIEEIAVKPVNLYKSIFPVTMSTGLRLGF